MYQSLSRILPAILLVVLMCESAQAQKLPDGVTKGDSVEGMTEYRLNNGLRVVLIPDASQPKVTVNMTVFCGSRHEGYGETGMAHLLEHMVFKGCPKFPEVPKALRDHGATFNGTTWVDRTNYYETMPAGDENLEFGIELEADRLTRSFLKREDLMSEFTVVRNEFEAGENVPMRVLLQRMTSTAYEWHNYGKSTIGNKADIERVPIENLEAFYRKYYRPDNAMLVVAGKFTEAKALELIAKHFGPLKKPADPLPKTYTEEPPQDGERLVTLRRVGTVAVIGAAYHVPSASHADFPACYVLEGVLSNQPSGRLYKALVESKKASSVYGMAFAWHDPGLLVVGAETEPSNTDAARDMMLKVLEGLPDSPITEDEVDRIKRQFKKDREQLVANSQRLAIELSEWAGTGDWRLFFLHRDRMEQVKAADVNRAAARYLVRSNRTVGIYVPTKAAERTEVPAAPDVSQLVKGYKGREAVAKGEEFDPTPENVEARAVRGTIGGGVKTAVLEKKTRGNTVNMVLTLRFGNEDALKGKVEAAEFLGSMLMRGTKTRTRQQIQDELDKLGAQVTAGSSAGVLTVRIQAKRDNLASVLEIVGDVLRNPTFPENEFDTLKREKIDQSEKGSTEPQVLALTALRRKLAPHDPGDVRYTPTVAEAVARAKAVTVKEVRDVYETMLGGGTGEFAAVGDLDGAATLKQLDAILKGWTAKVPYKRIDRKASATAGGTEVILTPDKANSVYLAGLTIPLSDSDPDYPALVIGNYALGASPLSSRLSNRVRGKDGLSYGVMSMVQADPIDKQGAFLTFAIANPMNMTKVDAAIAEEIKNFIEKGTSADELEGAKNGYLQSRRVARSNDATLAAQLSSALYTGRPFTFESELEKRLAAIQPGDVKRAFEKHVNPKNLAIIQAGDFKKAQKEPPSPEKK
jgi:zinc protease